MNKKILSGVFALALLGTTGYGVNKSMNGNADLSNLALNNVEALAKGEITVPWLCQDWIQPCVFEADGVWFGYRIF
jgi:hypothetical protein